MEIFGLIFILVFPVLLGGFLAAPFHRFRGLSGWLASGTVCGLTLFTGINFFLTLFWGKISWFPIGITLLIMFFLVYWVRKYIPVNLAHPVLDEHFQKSKIRQIALFFLLGLSALIIFLSFREVLHINSDGYFIGFKNNLGDLPLHMHFSSSFLFGDNFPPKSPFFSGIPLRYPFLCDFYSAVFWFATHQIEWAFEIPGMVLSFSLLILLYQWGSKLTSSRILGALVPFLFFFNGSMRWIYDVEDYSNLIQEKFNWLNVIYALLIPQRSLQFAFPMFILLISICLEAAKDKDSQKFLFLSLLAAFMPLFHGHSLIVLTLLGGFFVLFYPSKAWLWLLVPLFFFWLPQVLYLAQILGENVPEAKSFIRFNLGWQSDGFLIPWFWLKNTGPFIPMVILGFYLNYKQKLKNKMIYQLALGGLGLFVLGNLILFAPWEWDNIKIFIFWYLVSLPLVCMTLGWFFRLPYLWSKLLVVVFIGFLTLSSFFDLRSALFTTKENYNLFNPNQISLAEVLKEKLSKNSILLSEPTYNSPVVLTGRALFLGYLGHIWSHGYSAIKREKVIKHLAKGNPSVFEDLKKNNISHILFGPKEHQKGYNSVFLTKNFKIQYAGFGYILYEVKSN